MEDGKRARITVRVSPEQKITKQDLIKFSRNLTIFTAPALVVFFAQLKMGVEPTEALPLALLILYGLLADLFKKWSNKKYY